MKRVISDNELPAALRAEFDSLSLALTAKYGKHTVQLGVHIENLATIVTMLQDPDLTATARAAACAGAKHVFIDILRDLGTAWQVEPEAAFAVAKSLQDYSMRVNETLAGEKPFDATISDAIMVAINQKIRGAQAQPVVVPAPAALDATPSKEAKDIN